MPVQISLGAISLIYIISDRVFSLSRSMLRVDEIVKKIADVLTNVKKWRKIFFQTVSNIEEQANFLLMEEFAGLFQAAGSRTCGTVIRFCRFFYENP